MKPKYWLWSLLGTFFSCVSCSTKHRVWLSNSGEQKVFNLPYGTHKRQVMDIFTPKEIKEDRTAVLIIHGGAWKYGRKEHIAPIQRFLLGEGFVSVNMNYRLVSPSKGITYRQQLEDIESAIQKFVQFSEKSGIRYRDLVVLGESAGGHLALLYGYKNPTKISKIISLSGPTDFYSQEYLRSSYFKLSKGVIEQVVGEKYIEPTPMAFREASPIYQPTNVPTLHFQGEVDILVDKAQGRALDSVLSMKNISHRFIYMPRKGHVPRLFNKKYREEVIYKSIKQFLEED